MAFSLKCWNSILKWCHFKAERPTRSLFCNNNSILILFVAAQLDNNILLQIQNIENEKLAQGKLNLAQMPIGNQNANWNSDKNSSTVFPGLARICKSHLVSSSFWFVGSWWEIYLQSWIGDYFTYKGMNIRRWSLPLIPLLFLFMEVCLYLCQVGVCRQQADQRINNIHLLMFIPLSTVVPIPCL